MQLDAKVGYYARKYVQVKLGTSDFRDSTYSLSWLNMTQKNLTKNLTELLKTMALPVEKGLLMFFKKKTTTLEIFKSTCITIWWLNHPFETYHMIVKS